MIHPDPIGMVNENGREFEIQLGRMEQVSIIDTANQSVNHEAVEKVPSEGSPEIEAPFEEKWVQYAID